MKSITVLMSTYNGEKYLREQIDSLLGQRKVDLKILVRDDGSCDNTLSILHEYEKKYDHFIFYKGENLGPAYSFFDLLSKAEKTDYYAFCDQDDIWDNDKLITAIKKLEMLDSEVPNLYYSNLRIVDEHMNFYRLSHDKPLYNDNKYSALTEGLCTGCTAVFNNTAKEIIAENIPKFCTMHDTWLYMTCKILGNTIYDEEPHISYRQHDGNVVGTYLKKNITKALEERIIRAFRRDYQPRYMNSKSFYQCYEQCLNELDKKKILKVLNYKKSFKQRLSLIFDKDIKPTKKNDRIRFIFHIIWGTV